MNMLELFEKGDYKEVKCLTDPYSSVTVYLVEKDGQMSAMKRLPCGNERSLQAGYKEFCRQLKVSGLHKTILPLKKCSFNETEILILTDYMERGTIQDVIDESTSWNSTSAYIWAIGVAIGVLVMHKNDIAHRDLKPANIFLDEYNHPMIADFGYAKVGCASMAGTRAAIGTYGYKAPEVFDGNEGGYSAKAADVYSYSLLLYSIIKGQNPWDDSATPERFEMGLKKGTIRPETSDLSPVFVELLSKCWSSDPKERPTMDNVVRELLNPKFKFKEANEAEIHGYVRDILESNELECFSEFRELADKRLIMLSSGEAVINKYGPERAREMYNWGCERGYPDAYYWRSMMYWKDGDLERADEFLRKAEEGKCAKKRLPDTRKLLNKAIAQRKRG